MKFLLANRLAPDGTPHFATSHLGLFCFPMSHKKDARLIWVNKGIDVTSLYFAGSFLYVVLLGISGLRTKI